MTTHGCAYLGASVARAVRIAALRFPFSDGDCNDVWDSIARIVTLLGRGTVHTDEVIGNACSDGLAIALSFDGLDAPVLHGRMYKSCSIALMKLAEALVRYGHGDYTDTMRVTRLARASGMCLAATTYCFGGEKAEETVNLGQSRIACVNALFGLLGSSSFRKDEEIGLVVGESLALYADSFSPQSVVWSSACTEWPSLYSEDFAVQLPPHRHVLYVLLEKMAKSSSPHLRNACAPALLAVVAKAARGVSALHVLVAVIDGITDVCFEFSYRFTTTLRTPNEPLLLSYDNISKAFSRYSFDF
jgi:proteasome component ECM29